MANSLLIQSEGIVEYNLNSTQFMEIFGDGNGGFLGSSLTNSDKQIVLSSGTLSNFWINVTTNTNSNSTTLTFIKNSVNGNQTISINANTSGTFTDAAHTDSIVVNDLISLKFVWGSSTISFQMSATAFTFAAGTFTVTKLVSSLPSSLTNATSSNTYFRTALGATSGLKATTEAQAKNRQRKAGTFENCCAHANSNSNVNASTWRSRKNGANGSISISISASTTGDFTDTSDTDSISPGDDYCYSYTTGASTVSIEIAWSQIDFVSTNQDSIHSIAYDAGESINTATTNFCALSGDLSNPLAAENCQVLVNNTYTFSELTINLQSNGITNASTLTLRANASDVISLSVPASSSGVFSDSSDTYVAASTDLMNYKLVTAATGTSMTISHISVWANLSPPPPAGPTGFPRSFKNIPERPDAPKLKGFGNQAPTFGGF